MSLEKKSQQLKDLVSVYDTEWFLGNISDLMHAGGNYMAQDQLGTLSSPQRQLYYLSGLLVSTDPQSGVEKHYSMKEWGRIVKILNEIEYEYDKIFFPANDQEIDPQWIKARKVAMPSFLGYFNQGPLNFEEQTISWVESLFTHFDSIIEEKTGVTTKDFLNFYTNLDNLHQANFQGHGTNPAKLRENWESYTKIKMGVAEGVPDLIKKMGQANAPMFTYRSDPGIIARFYPTEIASADLQLAKVEKILSLLSCKRETTDFLYYTSSNPGNPLFSRPIVDIGGGLYQVFEVKQVIHAIQSKMEQICQTEKQDIYVKRKGNLLEERIVELFKTLLDGEYRIFTSYYVDSNEQDILILWNDVAFIIEAKGYNLQEPFRDPEKAYKRIKQSFDACIGYGYQQTHRIEEYFNTGKPLKIYDDKGNLVETIDTTQYSLNCSIIVNQLSFGQVQIDLSELLERSNEKENYPWAVKFDDLETFILAILALKKDADFFIDFLTLRELLHGKVLANDELQICGAYLTGELTEEIIDKNKKLKMTPQNADVFDELYRKGLGFKNEKMLDEKQNGKHMFF